MLKESRTIKSRIVEWLLGIIARVWISLASSFIYFKALQCKHWWSTGNLCQRPEITKVSVMSKLAKLTS